MSEMPRFAHLMILLLMGAEFTVTVGVAAALYGAIARRWTLARLAGGGAACIAAGYFCVLLGVGGLSGEKILAPGRWKYFCEADCHIAYSIDSVQTAETSSPAPALDSSGARRVAVHLKTWFDENSIASFRGNRPLAPEPRRVVLVDSSGREFPPLPGAEAARAEHSTPLTQPLRPGESYTTSFLFDVPRDARDLRLLVTDEDPVSRFVIDHENSPFHGKILLRLEGSAGTQYSARR